MKQIAKCRKRGRADVDAMRTRSGRTLILIINWNLRLSVYAQTASYVEQRASVSLSLSIVFGIVAAVVVRNNFIFIKHIFVVQVRHRQHIRRCDA